jgi:hypothetical protein
MNAILMKIMIFIVRNMRPVYHVRQMQVCTVQNATVAMRTSFVVENVMNADRTPGITARNVAFIMIGAKLAEKEHIA